MLETLVAILAVLGADLLQRLHRDEDQRRSVCRRLRQLLTALQSIVRTSDEIDTVERNVDVDTVPQLRKLFRQQRENIHKAVNALKNVAPALDIKAPQLAVALAARLAEKDAVIRSLDQAARKAEYERLAAMSLGLSSLREIGDVESVIDQLVARDPGNDYSDERSGYVMEQLRVETEHLRVQLAEGCDFNDLGVGA